MRPVQLLCAVPASILALALVATAPAYAAPATFVSPTGNNTNNCTSPATPCDNPGAALTKTDEGGVIHVLPGTYGGFIIDKAIEIVAETGQVSIANAAIAIPGGNGFAEIVVNAGPDDEVRIRGFILDGGPIAALGDSHGVALIGGAALHLEDCALVNAGSSFGVAFRPVGASELYVSNCAISGNGDSAGGGIQIRPTGAGSAKVALDNVLIENNRTGIVIDGAGSTGGIDMSVADSTISGNTTVGIGVFEAVSGAPSSVVLARATISSNGGQGIFVSRALATVRVRQSEITGNAVGVQSANGGQLVSHGDNVLAGNTTNGAFSSTLPEQ
jgi:hypothetical protein